MRFESKTVLDLRQKHFLVSHLQQNLFPQHMFPMRLLENICFRNVSAITFPQQYFQFSQAFELNEMKHWCAPNMYKSSYRSLGRSLVELRSANGTQRPLVRIPLKPRNLFSDGSILNSLNYDYNSNGRNFISFFPAKGFPLFSSKYIYSIAYSRLLPDANESLNLWNAG